MRAIRRSDLAPRLEMMPLIDVIFLLLTFFIYQMVVMRPVDALGFELAPVAGGQQAVGARLDILSIDADGALALNGQSLADAELDGRLTEFAADPAEPTLYITMDTDSRADRGPVIFDLLQRVRAAGIANVAIVGTPEPR